MEGINWWWDDSKNNQKSVTTPVSDEVRKWYEEKYLDESFQALNSLVAPQTSGAKILDLLGFKKEGDIYPEFQKKQVTDIGWWLSSLAFELSPSVEKIIVVDPMFLYDRKALVDREAMRAENRIKIFDALYENVLEGMLIARQENKKNTQEVADGIKKWQEYDASNGSNIQINDSFAQSIQWIENDSQDVTFLNFVLDKLNGVEWREKEIVSALENTYRITKPWGKTYIVYDKVHNVDDIMAALDQTGYKRNGEYKWRYMCSVINKQS